MSINDGDEQPHGKQEREARAEVFSPDQLRFEYFARNLPAETIEDLLPHFGIEPTEAVAERIQRWREFSPEIYRRLVTSIHGWVAFQELLPLRTRSSAETTVDLARMNLQHFPYYEATLALGESLGSVLDGHPIAARAMLRPFVEQALAEVHVHGGDDERRIDRYFSFLEGSGPRPKFGNMLDDVFSEPRFQQFPTLEERVRIVYAATSSLLHLQIMDETGIEHLTTNRLHASAHEAEWVVAAAVAVHRMLALLALRFPMSLFPVDVIRRFGYSRPVGVFADQRLADIVTASFSESDLGAMRESLANDPEVCDLLEWVNSQRELTDAEIDVSWQAYRESARLEQDDDRNEIRVLLVGSVIAAMNWLILVGAAAELVRPVPDFDFSDAWKRDQLLS